MFFFPNIKLLGYVFCKFNLFSNLKKSSVYTF